MNDGPKPLIKLCLETDLEFRPPHIVDPEDNFKFEDGLGHFLNCLREKRPTNVPVHQACYSLKVCQAMRESARILWQR